MLHFSNFDRDIFEIYFSPMRKATVYVDKQGLTLGFSVREADGDCDTL